MIRRVVWGLLVLLLAGCASQPNIRVLEDTTVDFSEYRTFSYFPQLGTDRAQYRSIVSEALKTATTREMTARGYVLTENDPDLLINFSGKRDEKVRVTSTPAPGGYYGYRRYGVWGTYPQEIRVREYTEGTLNIDIVDARRNLLVWEGVAEGTVSKADLENPVPAINEAVQLVFGRFDHQAGTR